MARYHSLLWVVNGPCAQRTVEADFSASVRRRGCDSDSVDAESAAASTPAMPSTHPTLREFGRRVRERRLELALSQEELADRADLHRTYISSLEQGRRNVAIRNLVRLAEALDFDPAELVRGLRSR
jgi:ribosome-binding protein aMBF1 (putative translation factor)